MSRSFWGLLTNEVWAMQVDRSTRVKVFKTEEKGSDVNLASHLNSRRLSKDLRTSGRYYERYRPGRTDSHRAAGIGNASRHFESGRPSESETRSRSQLHK